jgi:hypothetical protein
MQLEDTRTQDFVIAALVWAEVASPGDRDFSSMTSSQENYSWDYCGGKKNSVSKILTRCKTIQKTVGSSRSCARKWRVAGMPKISLVETLNSAYELLENNNIENIHIYINNKFYENKRSIKSNRLSSQNAAIPTYLFSHSLLLTPILIWWWRFRLNVSYRRLLLLDAHNNTEICLKRFSYTCTSIYICLLIYTI